MQIFLYFFYSASKATSETLPLVVEHVTTDRPLCQCRAVGDATFIKIDDFKAIPGVWCVVPGLCYDTKGTGRQTGRHARTIWINCRAKQSHLGEVVRFHPYTDPISRRCLCVKKPRTTLTHEPERGIPPSRSRLSLFSPSNSRVRFLPSQNVSSILDSFVPLPQKECSHAQAHSPKDIGYK